MDFRDAEEDPFETRLEFVHLLERLNASQQSIQKVSAFALRYPHLYEELYTCIMEEMEGGTMNARLNLLYVLDSISQQSRKRMLSGTATAIVENPDRSAVEGVEDYRQWVYRDLARILDWVASNDSKGIVNIAPVLKVLKNWRQKQTFADIAGAMERIAEWEETLVQRQRQGSQSDMSELSPVLTAEASAPAAGYPNTSRTSSSRRSSHGGGHSGSSIPAVPAGMPMAIMSGEGPLLQEHQHEQEKVPVVDGDKQLEPLEPSRRKDNKDFSKRDILCRIEEDRERHKLLKQDVWMRNYDRDTDTEFEECWQYTRASEEVWSKEMQRMRQEVQRMYQDHQTIRSTGEFRVPY